MRFSRITIDDLIPVLWVAMRYKKMACSTVGFLKMPPTGLARKSTALCIGENLLRNADPAVFVLRALAMLVCT